MAWCAIHAPGAARGLGGTAMLIELFLTIVAGAMIGVIVAAVMND